MKDKCVKTSKIDWREIAPNVFEKLCLAGNPGLSISVLKIQAGQLIAPHKHAETRYNFVLSGSMTDGKDLYSAGDIVINEKGSEHYLQAGDEGCEFILIW